MLVVLYIHTMSWFSYTKIGLNSIKFVYHQIP